MKTGAESSWSQDFATVRALLRSIIGIFRVFALRCCTFLAGIGTMITSAGIFGVCARGAFREIEIKFGIHSFAFGGGFDLHDDGVIVAGGHGLIGDQFVAVLGEDELGGFGAVPEGCGDHLLTGCDHFVVVIDETDFDFLVLVHEKLDVRFDSGDQLATGGAGFDLVVIVFVFGTGVAGESKGDGGEGDERFQFDVGCC